MDHKTVKLLIDEKILDWITMKLSVVEQLVVGSQESEAVDCEKTLDWITRK